MPGSRVVAVLPRIVVATTGLMVAVPVRAVAVLVAARLGGVLGREGRGGVHDGFVFDRSRASEEGLVTGPVIGLLGPCDDRGS